MLEDVQHEVAAIFGQEIIGNYREVDIFIADLEAIHSTLDDELV